MKNQALQYFMHDGPSAFRFELAGDLDNEGARRLEQDWRTASSTIGGRALIVDLTFVTSAGEEARALLARWHAAGARIVAKSKASRELAEEIVGQPPSEFAAKDNAGAGWTWLPFRTSFSTPRPDVMLLCAALLLPIQAHGANLRSETVAAWDNYGQTVSASMQDRVRPSGNFLWTYEDPERVARVHAGEVVVAAAPGQNPRKVAGGLIHHWIGAAFLAGMKLDDVLEVTRDYDRYKEFYRPSVKQSKTILRGHANDIFSMLLINRTFFLKSALDADYQATNVRLDDRRFYSVSKTTRVQEIEDYGQAGEHQIPEGEGSGYIWKLLSIGRLEQADGGVYVEMETVALSRDIPGVMRVVVDPIVRRVSRSAILTSITQTEDAVRSNCLAAVKPANSPANVEHASSAAAALKNNASAFAGIH